MKTTKKWIALALVAVMMMCALAGCGKQEQSKTSSAPETQGSTEQSKTEVSSETAQEPEIDISERVELVAYFCGDEPAGMDRVNEKINEILLDKINATITFNFTTWTDNANKLRMVLAGEGCDIMFQASWLGFLSLAKDEAFLELSDLIDTYAPELREQVDESYFSQSLVDGKLYGIPHTHKAYTSSVLMYREDLRKKYDLPVPDSIENVEAYAQGIKDNEPTMVDIITNPADVLGVFRGPAVTGLDSYYGTYIDYNNPKEVIKYYGSDAHLEELKTIRKWAEAGYWSKSALANTASNKNADFIAGKTALLTSGLSIDTFYNIKSQLAVEQPDWEIGGIATPEISGVAYPTAPMQNCTVIPHNAKNPERAMMAIELFLCDKELNHLFLYGIEGEDYTLDADGLYVPIEGSDYPYEAGNCWNFKNNNLILEKAESKEKLAMYERMDEIASKTNYPFINMPSEFSMGYAITNTNAESAVKAVRVEYLDPLKYGAVEDVEAGLKKFMEEAEKVGLTELQDEFIELWTEYVNEKGY